MGSMVESLWGMYGYGEEVAYSQHDDLTEYKLLDRDWIH
jgi:hypothetical protein